MATKKTGARKGAGNRRTTAKRTQFSTARKSTSRNAGASTTRAGKTNTKTTARKSAGSTNSRSRAERGSAPENDYSKAQTTTDHAQIQRWVEERGGYPAAVAATETLQDPGILRIDYPGYSGQGTLERITWQEFFDKFDEQDLVFLYQDETKDGGPSRFSKLISRAEAERNRS